MYGGRNMVKVIFVLMLAALIVIPVLVSCTSGRQTSLPVVVDNQSGKPQSQAEVDNRTILKSPDLRLNQEEQQKIVFVSWRDAIWMWNWSYNLNSTTGAYGEIYIMDADGNNQLNLTNNPSNDFIPSLSPDGKKILFVSDRKWEPDNKMDDNLDIFVMNVDGSNVKNLTGHRAWDTMPRWSPDGSMIVFLSSHSGWPCLWAMDAEGKNFLNLTPNRNSRDWNFYIWPAWSPDGKKIVYTTGQDGNYTINAMEIDYTLIKQILLNPIPDNYKGEAWSTTGDRRVARPITISSYTNQDRVPWLIGIRTLTSGTPSGYAGTVSFSPDGKRIAYLFQRKDINTEICDIYIMNEDGSNPVNLTNSFGTTGKGAFNDWPVWSPDGEKIAFASDRDGKPLWYGPYKYALQIYVMDADGDNVTRVINNNFADVAPSWGIVPYVLAEKLRTPKQPTLTVLPEANISALDLDQINKYYGREVAIEGKVVDYAGAWDAETRPMLLYFDNPKQHCMGYDEWKQGQCGTDFRVVINIQDFKKFPDVFTYMDNRVRVIGIIDRYRGAPCIVATDPQQITIIN
jgi:Tol biopolymer transport system component